MPLNCFSYIKCNASFLSFFVTRGRHSLPPRFCAFARWPFCSFAFLPSKAFPRGTSKKRAPFTDTFKPARSTLNASFLPLFTPQIALRGLSQVGTITLIQGHFEFISVAMQNLIFRNAARSAIVAMQPSEMSITPFTMRCTVF